MRRGLVGSDIARDQGLGFEDRDHPGTEPIDAPLGPTVAHTDRDRLSYVADLIAELQTMAVEMRLGMLASILSVGLAEAHRLLEPTPGSPRSGGTERQTG